MFRDDCINNTLYTELYLNQTQQKQHLPVDQELPYFLVLPLISEEEKTHYHSVMCYIVLFRHPKL